VLNYALRRLLALVPTLIVISLVAFAVMRILPGNAAAALMGLEATSENAVAISGTMGLDQPLFSQYLQWMWGLLHGDLGSSVFLRQPVSEAVATHLGPTLSLALIAQGIALIVALPCGVYAAWKHGGALDVTLRTVSLVGVAVPGFVLALFLMLWFGEYLRWLPVAGYAQPGADFLEYLRHLILPSTALGLVQAALILRMTRSSMLQSLSLDCIRTARAKGMPERLVLWKHALRCGILPVLTVVGQSFGSLIAGAVIIETIFNIPGMGQLITHAILRRDVVVVQSVMLVLTLLYAGVNLGVDLLYGLADSRLRTRSSKVAD
jgi:peptide/nickel transport system permease protein